VTSPFHGLRPRFSHVESFSESWRMRFGDWSKPDGVGDEQVRWRHWVPAPQDTLHEVQLDHTVQPPSISARLDPPTADQHTMWWLKWLNGSIAYHRKPTSQLRGDTCYMRSHHREKHAPP